MSGRLDELVAESRDAFRPESVDWSRLERDLFARVEADRRRTRSHASRERGHVWAAAGTALAAAVVVFLLVARPHPRITAQPEGDGLAATLMATRGTGELLVNGAPAAIGASLRLGDVVDARGVEATLVRAGRVTVVVEAGARAVVARVENPLVLTLERGAVDAQVVPVPSGEAFAVDVDGSRVAVHGTHLRVAREGVHVIVDLSEGVVSVGHAPRAGSVLGALVTAPAHTEFSASDIRGTMRVTHDPASVREPMAGFDPVVAPDPPAAMDVTAAAPARAPTGPSDTHPAFSQAPAKSATIPIPDPVMGPPAGEAAPSSASSSDTPPIAAGPDPSAEGTVAGAVRRCMSEHPHPDNVSIAVSTTLYLWVSDQGKVRSARFDPPVAPDVNACAADVIYRTPFQTHGSVHVRVDYKD